MRSKPLHPSARLAVGRAQQATADTVSEVDINTPITALPGGAVVRSLSMHRLYGLVSRAARTTLPVLILGETGSGKELVARAVHENSPRAKGPFKAINCATLPVNLVESTLFGHERGSFTGADRRAAGLFEQAKGGSVFLDEIGELAPHAQAALLRVLELGRAVRVGGTEEVEVDVRVIAATHRDLDAMATAGEFREDLLFRLDAVSLRVPPLRERREEIGPLAELFLKAAQQRWNGIASSFSAEALVALDAYGWPGNVRQLKNVIERAAALCAHDVIQLADLQLAPRVGVLSESIESDRRKQGLSLPARVRMYEIGLIRSALEQARGNRTVAARLLDVPRRTLTHKVRAYGLIENAALLQCSERPDSGE